MAVSNPSVELLDLPVDVLGLIFSTLPLKDRKNVRLTCHQFYESCNIPSILLNEVITCSTIRDPTFTVNTLSNFSRSLWNLELNYVHLVENTHLSFFESRGVEIRSLSFFNCQFAPSVLEFIIRRCEFLNSISFKFSAGYKGDVNTLFNDFSMLELASIIRDNVTSFKLEMFSGKWLSNRKFHKFFAVFPNLKQLVLEIDDTDELLNELSVDPMDIMSDTKFSFSSVYHCILAIGDRLEKLRLRFFSYELCPTLLAQTFSSLANLKNLKELSFSWNNLVNAEILTYFLQFRHLTSIECFDTSWNADVNALLCHLLNNNLELHHLKLNSGSAIAIDFQLFKLLISSKLKTFFIGDTEIGFSSDFSMRELLLPNYTLKSLTLAYEELKEDCMLKFTTYFRGLEHLSLPNASKGVLYNILNYQKNLRSLILDHCDWSSNSNTIEIDPLGEPSCDSSISFRELQRLEYLELDAWQDDQPFAIDTLADFICPNLTYFVANFKTGEPLPGLKEYQRNAIYTSYMDALFQTIQQLPRLEALCLYSPKENMPFDVWHQICLLLPNLRYLCIIIGCYDEQCEKNNFKMLFDACASLRAVVFKSKSSNIIMSYFYDLSKKTMTQKMGGHNCHLLMPKVGSFVVNWMTY